jgi:hypothetical protein
VLPGGVVAPGSSGLGGELGGCVVLGTAIEGKKPARGLLRTGHDVQWVIHGPYQAVAPRRLLADAHPISSMLPALTLASREETDFPLAPAAPSVRSAAFVVQVDHGVAAFVRMTGQACRRPRGPGVRSLAEAGGQAPRLPRRTRGEHPPCEREPDP